MALVSSIRHHAITNDYNDGARALKNYLRYAEAISAGDSPPPAACCGRSTPPRMAANVPPSTHVVVQTGTRLRERGYRVDSMSANPPSAATLLSDR